MSTATNGEEALRLAEGEQPDLIILDLMLPRIDGFEVCRRLRANTNTPIIILSAKGDEVDKVTGFRRARVGEATLQEARKLHETAHVMWEWWTAENSDGFHNPDQAREALATSIEASMKGVELLEKAMKP